MRILLVNDDGIDAIGIKLLENSLKKYGDVIVVAPDKGMSAMSHAIQIKAPIRVNALDDSHYAISSTPVDCVRLGVDLFGPFDYVFSGINNGLNLGTDILYSGTTNAAIEGTILGIPSVAISTDINAFDIVNNEIDDVINQIFSKKLYDKDYALNINFPIKDYSKSLGLKYTVQGMKDFKTHFIQTKDGYVACKEEIKFDQNGFTDVFQANLGYITYTYVNKFQQNK